MAKRGRLIAVALVLLGLFLYLTSRHSGSHPRDLHAARFQDTQIHEELRPVLKEPPGKWDPVGDRFQEEHGSTGGRGAAIQNQADAIANPALRVNDEIGQRKTPKKGGQDSGKAEDMLSHVKGQPEPQKQPKKQSGVGGSGAVLPGEENAAVPGEYDPAEGILNRNLF
jgi:hypothetical protein